MYYWRGSRQGVATLLAYLRLGTRGAGVKRQPKIQGLWNSTMPFFFLVEPLYMYSWGG